MPYSYYGLRRSLQRVRNVRNESGDRSGGNQVDNVAPHSEDDPSWERTERDEDFQHPDDLLDIFCDRWWTIGNLEGHLEENGRFGGRLGENNRVGGRFEDFQGDVVILSNTEEEDEGLSAERVEKFCHFDALI